jgi:hypothetical protein
MLRSISDWCSGWLSTSRQSLLAGSQPINSTNIENTKIGHSVIQVADSQSTSDTDDATTHLCCLPKEQYLTEAEERAFGEEIREIPFPENRTDITREELLTDALAHFARIECLTGIHIKIRDIKQSVFEDEKKMNEITTELLASLNDQVSQKNPFNKNEETVVYILTCKDFKIKNRISLSLVCRMIYPKLFEQENKYKYTTKYFYHNTTNLRILNASLRQYENSETNHRRETGEIIKKIMELSTIPRRDIFQTIVRAHGNPEAGLPKSELHARYYNICLLDRTAYSIQDLCQIIGEEQRNNLSELLEERKSIRHKIKSQIEQNNQARNRGRKTRSCAYLSATVLLALSCIALGVLKAFSQGKEEIVVDYKSKIRDGLLVYSHLSYTDDCSYLRWSQFEEQYLTRDSEVDSLYCDIISNCLQAMTGKMQTTLNNAIDRCDEYNTLSDGVTYSLMALITFLTLLFATYFSKCYVKSKIPKQELERNEGKFMRLFAKPFLLDEQPLNIQIEEVDEKDSRIKSVNSTRFAPGEYF